ncbi:MAG TPA: TIGR01777 family oxidoreductase [Thermoanaerobaculia bacterium]|jgi:hypothetical protein
MKIVIAGGSGFLGEPLVRRLVARGDEVVVLSRNAAKVKAGRGVAWNGRSHGPWTAEVDTADAVINLAGENIAEGRWTEERKKRLVESRVQSTRALVDALRRERDRPRALLNASAVGYYGNRGDELLDESAKRGDGFLAELVARWEETAKEAEEFARVAILRLGVVLAADGGALAKLLPPFRMGAGGPIGSGKQWMSWVSRDDAVRMFEWALDDATIFGVYNVTAPEPVRNRDFAKALGRAVHRPALIPTPAFALRLAFGEMADEALIAGQRVIPKHATREGFTFEQKTLDAALRHALGK